MYSIYISLILFSRLSLFRLLGQGRVMVGLNSVVTPYESGKYKYTIRKLSTSFIRVKTVSGFELMWDQNQRLYLTLDASYKNKVE